MPRGKPKKGQFDFVIWLPTGGRLQVRTTEDRPLEKWVAQVREGIKLMTKAVNATQKASKARTA